MPLRFTLCTQQLLMAYSDVCLFGPNNVSEIFCCNLPLQAKTISNCLHELYNFKTLIFEKKGFLDLRFSSVTDYVDYFGENMINVAV